MANPRARSKGGKINWEENEDVPASTLNYSAKQLREAEAEEKARKKREAANELKREKNRGEMKDKPVHPDPKVAERINSLTKVDKEREENRKKMSDEKAAYIAKDAERTASKYKDNPDDKTPGLTALEKEDTIYNAMSKGVNFDSKGRVRMPSWRPKEEVAYEAMSGIKDNKFKKGGKVGKKNWIAGAIKKPGALRQSLGVKEGEKIPAKKLASAAKKPGKMGQRARLAQTLKGFNGGGSVRSKIDGCAQRGRTRGKMR